MASHRLIFCINPGRSGSRYLATLIGSAQAVDSHHEAEPTMSGRYVAMVNAAGYETSRAVRRVKADAIAARLACLPDGATYVETNHMFIKTFYDVVVERFENVEVVVLQRELARVLKSFMELRYFTSENPFWREWMTEPDAVTAAIRCVEPRDRLDPVDRAIAYLIDIEARAARFAREHPRVRTHPVRCEHLNRLAGVEALFQRLHLAPTDLTRETCGRRINERLAIKARYGVSVDVAYCRDRIQHYLDRAHAQGIDIPGSLALEPAAES